MYAKFGALMSADLSPVRSYQPQFDRLRNATGGFSVEHDDELYWFVFLSF